MIASRSSRVVTLGPMQCRDRLFLRIIFLLSIVLAVHLRLVRPYSESDWRTLLPFAWFFGALVALYPFLNLLLRVWLIVREDSLVLYPNGLLNGRVTLDLRRSVAFVFEHNKCSVDVTQEGSLVATCGPMRIRTDADVKKILHRIARLASETTFQLAVSSSLEECSGTARCGNADPSRATMSGEPQLLWRSIRIGIVSTTILTAIAMLELRDSPWFIGVVLLGVLMILGSISLEKRTHSGGSENSDLR